MDTNGEELETKGTEELDQELLNSLAGEEGFDEGEYGGESKAKREMAEYGKAADAVYARLKALNLPANHEVTQDCVDHLMSGRLDRAKAKLLKLEATRAAEIDHKAEERVRQQMASKGTPEETPEGEIEGKTSGDDPRAKYIRGEITAAEANELGAGLM